jgi:hypothetical protein
MTSVTSIILTGIVVAALAIAAGVQTYRLQGAQARAASLELELDSALADAAAWQAIAARHRATIDAQADLAEACLQREEQYLHDAAEIATILSATDADDPPPETTAKPGVSNATRKAAADDLNRPL